MGAFQFTPGIIPTVATLLMLCILVNLGFWQLRRAHAKEFIIDRLEQRSHLSPLSLDQLLEKGDDLSAYPLQLRGRFLPEFTFFLDNRTYNTQAGYEVLTAFLTGDRMVLVNRGWIGRGQYRDQFPQLPALPEPDSIGDAVTLTGVTHQPSPDYFVLKEDDYSQVQWPFLIQKVDLKKATQLFEYPLMPFVLRLQPQSQPQTKPGVNREKTSDFVRDWQSNMMGPEKHYGYALQWFSLAFALIVIFLVVNTSKITTKKTP